MKLFLDERQWAEKMQSVPAALRQRVIEDMEKHAERMGIHATGDGPGYIQVSLAGLEKPEHLFKFFDTAGICAVEVEPGDVPRLVGRNIGSLALKQGLESGEVTLPRLQPDELMDALQDARVTCGMNSSQNPLADA